MPLRVIIAFLCVCLLLFRELSRGPRVAPLALLFLFAAGLRSYEAVACP